MSKNSLFTRKHHNNRKFWFKRGLMLSLLFLCSYLYTGAQTTYYWTGGVAGDWTSSSNWNTTLGGGGTNRITPANTDILVIDSSDIGGGTQSSGIVITDVPTETIAAFSIINGQQVTLESNGAVLVTINGTTGTDVLINRLATLILNNSSDISLSLATGATAEVYGTITVQGASHTIQAADAGAWLFKEGSSCNTGSTFVGNVFGTGGTDGTVVFETGSAFISNGGSDPFGSGSKVVFSSGSTYNHNHSGSPAFAGKTYGNFVLNAAGTTTITSGSLPCQMENITIEQGTLNITGFNNTINLKGNIDVKSGCTLNISPGSGATLSFNKGGSQLISGSGTLTFGPNLSCEVSSNSTVLMERNVDMNGDITITSGSVFDLSPNNYKLFVGGDFINNGSFTERDGTVVFNGTAVQEIKGIVTFNHVEINNTSGVKIAGGSSNKVNITGILTLFNGTLTTRDNLVLEATGPTEYGQISGIGNGSISGKVTINKFLNNTDSGWRQMSLPVNGTIGDLNSSDLILTFSGTNTQNVFYWNSGNAGGGVAHGWQYASSGNIDTVGYAIYSNNTNGGLHGINQIFSISGNVNSGNKGPFALNYTTDPMSTGVNDDGWNLLPNPYPSNLDASVLFGATGFPVYKAVHIWDQINKQYRAITTSGVVVYNSTNSTGLNQGSHNIPPFTSFWVKVGSGGGSLTFTNTMRTTEIENKIFMKKQPELVRLDALDKNGNWDQAVVYFSHGATNGFDNEFDAYKLKSMNAEVPTVYSVIGTDKASINALPPGEVKYSVPVVFEASTDGAEYKFSLNTDDYTMPHEIWLHDNKTGAVTDMRNSTYSFEHDKQYSGNRFVLVFTSNPDGISEPKADKFIDFYTFNEADRLYLNYSGTANNAKVEVRDMLGRNVYAGPVNNGTHLLPIQNNTPGYFIVRVYSGNESVTRKTIKF